MCTCIFLLADRELPTPPDAAAYPGLRLHPVTAPAELAGIRRVAVAEFAYDVRPGEFCGCYFRHESPEEFAASLAERAADPDGQYADTSEQAAAMYQCQTGAVKSLGRLLADHGDRRLAVYVAWERDAGKNEPTRAAVPPSYFDAPSFGSLPEDVLLTIVPESDDDESRPWDPAATRDHDWLQQC